MYQLTIVENARNTTSEHPDWDRAYRALIKHVVGADKYLELIQAGRPHTSYDLLELCEYNDRRPRAVTAPRTVGHAVIEDLAGSTLDAESPTTSQSCSTLDQRQPIAVKYAPAQMIKPTLNT